MLCENDEDEPVFEVNGARKEPVDDDAAVGRVDMDEPQSESSDRT